VPRHPERFKLAEKLCVEKSLTVVRRSAAEPVSILTNVLIGDSMGEMLAYYSISDIAFVGGSLVNTGCQNVLEPAALGLPVLVGPSQFNFQTICEQLEEGGALKTARDEQDLTRAVCELLQDKELYARMSAAGPRIIEENRGALERTFQLVQNFITMWDHA
jgi:3-deoxy-D-manno-octulosonic-acid transferase